MDYVEALQAFKARHDGEDFQEYLNTLTSSDPKERVAASLLAIFSESQELRIRKQADYGLSWNDMGLLGVFCNIVSKVSRLRQLLWLSKDPQVASESIRDTLIDLLNYTFYAIYLLDSNNMKGPE